MSRWKDKLIRLGQANEAARLEALRALSHHDAIELLEGLLSNPPYPSKPAPIGADPGVSRRVSLGRLLRSRA